MNETETPRSEKAANESISEVYRTSRQLERELNEAIKQRDALAGALRKLRDCDFVITPHDRMDAVREIAREALTEVNL